MYQAWKKYHYGVLSNFSSGFQVPVPPGGGGLDISFNFRATSGFVTDGANTVYVLPTDLYTGSVIRGGQKFGWLDLTYVDGRDRSNTNDARIAGNNFIETGAIGSTPSTFQVDLLSTGTFNVEIDAGDATETDHVAYTVKDNTTTLYTFSDLATSAAQRFLDINGNEWTNATYGAGHTARSLAFSTTTFRFELTDLGGTRRVISHIRIFS